MQALIFAAGEGTRLRPLTLNLPKALVPVGTLQMPLLESVLIKLHHQGFDSVVINVYHLANQIEEFVRHFLQQHSDWNLKITLSDERDLLRQTGGGIRHAAPLLKDGGVFLIHNTDILSTMDLKALYCSHLKDMESQPRLLATLPVSERTTQRYFLFDSRDRLVGWTHLGTGEVRMSVPDVDPESCRRGAFTGIHVVSPFIFTLMEPWGEVFSVVDFYLAMAAEWHIKGVFQPDLDLVDVGKPFVLEALKNNDLSKYLY